MLEDYIINEQIRYENHYLKVAQTDIEIGGVTGAALLSALIVDTEEGVRRGIAIDSDAERMAWIAKYEREVRRDEWGLIGTEVELLNNAHIEIATSDVTWADICPNVLLLDLAFEVVTTYMQYLTRETFKDHIWEYCLWETPFSQWLLNAAYAETRRQQFIHTYWTDTAQVNALYGVCRMRRPNPPSSSKARTRKISISATSRGSGRDTKRRYGKSRAHNHVLPNIVTSLWHGRQIGRP